MGQKVHPYGFRLGINKPWKSRWFVERGYDKLLVEDVKLKAELREKLKAAGVSSVEVERPGNKLRTDHSHCASRHHHQAARAPRSTSSRPTSRSAPVAKCLSTSSK